MVEKFLNIFRIPDLRKRVLFTLAILAVYRLGAWIPTPGVNTSLLERLFDTQSGSALVDLRPGHHALHHGVDHLPVAHRGL
jgi:preprotein translocase subunit SecY